MTNLNKHIESYLSYYLNSPLNPGFAVLLQGKWGCGKTWFVKQFIEDHKKSNNEKKFVYITLYGVSFISEIEDQIFQALHPVLSSKTMALTGKILKGVVRASLNIDFDGDKKSDGSVSAQIPDIGLPDYLKNTSDCILIIDDLERCNIPLNNLLGYVNSFVEHQELKVIIIANEDELQANETTTGDDNLYRKIKEKLIGKTFRVKHDLERAYDSFVSKVEKNNARDYFKNNKETIIDIFNIANYSNLRHLKQCLWDFERFYHCIPDKYIAKSELMLDLLSLFFAFSFEIRSGQIVPADINELGLVSLKENIKKQNKDTRSPPTIDVVLNKYPFINAYDILLTEKAWRDLFDKGYLEEIELIECLENSKYYQDEKAPLWVKLWHFYDLEDDEFISLYDQVIEQWDKKEYKKPQEILHICGLFLNFSNKNIIKKNLIEVVTDCKAYIDTLKKKGGLQKHQQNSGNVYSIDRESWNGLGYAGNELEEFQEIANHIDKKINEAIIESLPKLAAELLEILTNNVRKFERMIYIGNAEDSVYYETPIFKYIDAEIFFNKFLLIPNSKKRNVILAMEKRYRHNNFVIKLDDEMIFLKKLQSLIFKKSTNNNGRLSGHILSEFSNSLSKVLAVMQLTISNRNK